MHTRNVNNPNKKISQTARNSPKQKDKSRNINYNSAKILNDYKSSTKSQSYLKGTENREKIIQNKKTIKENDLNSDEIISEHEAPELKKQKTVADKKNLFKKIKVDKLVVKDKDKLTIEDEKIYTHQRASTDRGLNEKKTTKENKIKDKKDNKKIIGKTNTSKKIDKDNNKLNLSKNKRKGSPDITKKNKEKINEEKNDNNIREEQEKIKQNNENKENKENIKNNYNQINNRIYRCLNCKLIPKIIINEFSKEISINCDCGISTHNNIINYKTFEENSLNHNNNPQCDYCNKKINEISQDEILYYCIKCDSYFCTKDEQLHFNQSHNQKENTIKNKYKNLIKEKKQKKVTEEPKKIRKLEKNYSTPRLTIKKDIGDKNNLQKKSKNEKKENINKNNDETLDKDKKLDNEKKCNSKIPVYLIDTYCILHDSIFNSYCHTCKKNICDICKTTLHKKHEIQLFDDILINDEILKQIKSELKIANENLSNLNGYFMSLIERIKCRFLKLYNAKKKEIQIKENIIKNYENIKYNYNVILNLKNLKVDNKNFNLQNLNNYDSNTNEDLLKKFYSIFEYLDSSSYSNLVDKRNFTCVSNILNGICLNEEKYICLSDDKGALKIIDSENFEENIKISNENKIINNLYLLSNGDIACCCNEKIEIINLDLFNKNYYINEIIENKNNSFLYITELKNDFLLTSGTKNKLQLWYKNNNNKRNFINYDIKNDVDFIYKIKPQIFLTSDNKNKKVDFFELNENYEIKNISIIDNISIINGNNPMMKFGNNYLLVCSQNGYKEYEIILIDLVKYKIVNKILYGSSKLIHIDLNNEFIITVDNIGLIKKWKIIENNIFNCGKMSIIDENKKMKFIISNKNSKLLLGVSNEKEVICLKNYYL